MPREWKHEIFDGSKIVESNRTNAVNLRLKAKYVRLWIALAIHYRSRLNAILAFALLELHRLGGKGDGEVPNLDVGMKQPSKIISRTPKVSKKELEVWDELVGRYGGGRRRVAVMALVELYKREPVELMVAMLPRQRRGSTGVDEGLPGSQ
jgi:hypothetical protein